MNRLSESDLIKKINKKLFQGSNKDIIVALIHTAIQSTSLNEILRGVRTLAFFC